VHSQIKSVKYKVCNDEMVSNEKRFFVLV